MPVHNDIGQLKQVIIHRPDEGIARVIPSRAIDLLYEDIVYLKKMREEHAVLTDILRLFLGADNVVDIEKLLADVLDLPEVRDTLLDRLSELEALNPDQIFELDQLKSPQLANVLITGKLKESTSFFDPIPNFVFTRDIGVVINSRLLIGQHTKKARQRESVLCHQIFQHHPRFFELEPLYMTDDLSLTIEGGDVMMFDKDTVLVGLSERTSKEAIERFCQSLFADNVVQRVVQVEMPKDRYCMHLDTIFTFIDHMEAVVYAPVILDGMNSTITVFKKDSTETPQFDSLGDFLKAESPKASFILCGGGEAPHDAREQWTDGCNFVAIKPGVAIGYDRNIKTAEALKKAGYSIISGEDLLTKAKRGQLDPAAIEKTIITIPSSELSRARGGAHCLTMPVERLVH